MHAVQGLVAYLNEVLYLFDGTLRLESAGRILEAESMGSG